MRAIADELRVRICGALAREAMTVTQLGALLGEPPAKIHYHVRELQRVGLVKLVETREKGGILEKYYRPVARTLRAPSTILQILTPDESIAAASEYLQMLSQGFLRTLSHAVESGVFEGEEAPALDLSSAQIWLTNDELKTLQEQIAVLIRPYEEPRGIPGERERMFAKITYETRLQPPTGQATAQEGAIAGPLSGARPDKGVAAPARRKVIVVGATHYSRRDLEAVVAQGDALDLYVIGYCSIADDVPSELADRAIARFRHRGPLVASPAVREVLKRKEA
jgi:hypothetical protein